MTKILLVNPPIYDFAAYDLWAKPLALLYLSSMLKQQNINVQFFDYMDRLSPLIKSPESNKYGCGHYIKQIIQKPYIFKNIKRNYYRFGIPENTATDYIKKLPVPNLIIINSVMTYWYLGIIEVAKNLKEIFPKTPIVLGGIYATLCYEHAKTLKNIDDVVRGSLDNFNDIFKKYNIDVIINANFETMPIPDYSLYNKLEYIVTRIGLGCPFSCSYCAQKILNNGIFKRKPPLIVKHEIDCLIGNNIKNVAFYDDALFYKADDNIKILLKEYVKDNKQIYFHTPNGLHARYIDKELAELMFQTNFINPRVSLETSNNELQKYSDNKVNNNLFEAAINNLVKAGYKKGEYTSYLLVGHKYQKLEDIKKSIDFVHSLGAKVSLSEYSPIPLTKDWEKIDEKYKKDPLYQNNTYYTLNNNIIDIQQIKLYAKELNKKLQSSFEN